jgi:hypothetical protein
MRMVYLPEQLFCRVEWEDYCIVVTMGMPPLMYRWFFGAYGVRGFERSMLSFAGIKPIREGSRLRTTRNGRTGSRICASTARAATDRGRRARCYSALMPAA